MELIFIGSMRAWRINVLLHHCYLLIILQLIVQDDSVRLVRLGPGEGDAVHSAADLVHYGYCGRSCEETKTAC